MYHSPSQSTSPWQPKQHLFPTPHWYSQDAIEVNPADSITASSHPKDYLYTEKASDGQTTFYIWLQLLSHDGMKQMTIKIDPGAQVNTIPLSKYHTLFPPKLNKSRFPKAKALLPTAHTWISHNGLPKPFLEHFVADIMHTSEPRPYPTWFYVFKDATSLHILFSYVTLERLGVIAFNVPNLAATSQVDNVAVSTSSSEGGIRKTAKCVTFWDPLVETNMPQYSNWAPTGYSSKRKTAHPNSPTYIKAHSVKAPHQVT